MDLDFFRLKPDHGMTFAINFANVAYISKSGTGIEVNFIGQGQPIIFVKSSPTYALLESWLEHLSELPDYNADTRII